MKDHHSEKKQNPRDASQPAGNTGRTPFNPQNESRSDRPSSNKHLSDLSKPPQRDMTGRRVDVDDTTFGVEIW